MNSNLKSDIPKKLLQGIYNTSLSHFGRQLFSIIANLYLLKTINPQSMGEFLILQFLVLQIPSFISIGLNMALIKDGEKLGIHSQQSLFYFQLFVSIVCIAVMQLSNNWIYEYYSKAEYIKNYLSLLFPIAPLLIFRYFLVSKWDMSLKFYKGASADLIDHVLYLVTAIISTMYFSPLESLLTGFLTGKLLSTLYLTFRFRSWNVFLPRFKWREVRQYLRFGSTVQLGNICNIASEAIIPLLLGKLSGPTSVGLVSWSMRIVWLPQSLTTYLNNITFVTFCNLPKKSSRYKWALGNLSKIVTAFTGFYLLLVNIFYSDLLKFIVGEQWLGTRTMVFCFSTFVFFYSAATIAVQSIFANKGENFLCKAAFFSFIARWTIGAAFLYVDGARGYGLYYLLMNIYSLMIYKKAHEVANFNWKDSLKEPFFAITISLPLFLFYQKITQNIPHTPTKIIIDVAVFTAIYCVTNYYLWAKKTALSLLRVYSKKEKKSDSNSMINSLRDAC